MSYSFESLSPADFEDLSRDLIGREIGIRFEAFGPGPDGGMDGRHANDGSTIIMQAKHYRLSSFAGLKREITRERASIDKMAPSRYILSTSRPLSPANKVTLANLIGPSLLNPLDIFSSGDLNALLKKYPDVTKSHVKLWLSGTAVLERVLHAATHNFTTITEEDIRSKLRVYVENPSFKAGRDILESQNVLIVSGPPGVGKTTLAEMLAYAYVGEDWDLVAIRSLEDGFEKITDTRKQVFFFDDFLGRIALDARALSNQDSDLAKFIGRIRRTPTARFILTTRAYIYEEARLLSEALSAKKLNVSNYVLDVGIYTRRIRARILYNHLLVTNIPPSHIAKLISTGTIATIVDHEHYNPRIIEWMTDVERVSETSAQDYPAKFVDALDNPDDIWDKAFRKHIPRKCQHLLFSIFFGSEYNSYIEDVEEIFSQIHPLLCNKYGVEFHPKDFEESLKTLEGSFLAIENSMVSFINPSIRDYLERYLMDKEILMTVAGGAPTSGCASHMEDQFNKIPGISDTDTKAFFLQFLPLSATLNDTPRWRRIASESGKWRLFDVSNSTKIGQLLGWWNRTGRAEFVEAALQVATAPNEAFSSFGDAKQLPALLGKLRADDAPETEPLASALEEALLALIDSNLDPDDLDRIMDAVQDHIEDMPATISHQLDTSIERAIENMPDRIGHIESESTLEDYSISLESFAKRTGVKLDQVQKAMRAIDERIGEIKEAAAEDSDLSVTGDAKIGEDSFEDDELDNLFSTLLTLDRSR